MSIGEKELPSANPTFLVRFGVWLSVKRNFLLYSIFGFGGLSYALLFAWLRIGHGVGGPFFWFAIAVLVAIAGYVWGLVMWQFFSAKREEWRSRGNRDA